MRGSVSRYHRQMQCNIDARGKAYRLMLGLAMFLAGAGLIAMRWRGPLADQAWDWPLYAGIGLLAMGAFGMFEGWAGWCVLRAMGIRTRV